MLGASYGTIADIEVLWTLIAAVGLGFSFFNVREAWLDKRHIERAGVSNGRRLLSQTNWISEMSRLVKQTIFVIIGILVMFLPEAPDARDQDIVLTLLGIFVRWGLITASILTTFQSYLGFRARRYLQRGG